VSRAKGRYVGVIDEGAAMFFNPRPGKVIETTVCAAVAFVQGKTKRVVQRGTAYRKGEEPKGLQARADKMALKWQGYLDRTGKRFELETDAKREKKEAAAKLVRARLSRAREKAPALAEAVAKIVGHWDFEKLLEAETTGDRLVQAARTVRELLDYIDKGESK
jgi:hypothetical protein